MSHPGLLYDGASARPAAVRWQVAGGDLVVESGAGITRVPLADVRAGSRVGDTRRVLQLAGGRQLHTDDNDAVDAAFPPAGIEVLVHRLERHALAVAASLVLTVAAGVLFIFVGLPALAERVARALPPEVEATLGDQALAILDRSLFGPTALAEDVQANLQRQFAGFVAGVEGGERLRLGFRSMDEELPNAIALPGGLIIFTDGLVALIEHDEEFLAILAHEVGHQADRHVMRSVLQQSALVAITAVVTGDVSAASGIVTAVPAFLLDNHYSRTFEQEADAYAFRSLAERGLSPAWFGRIMERLARDAGEEPAAEEEGTVDYASTHPVSATRIAAAVAAAGDEPPLGPMIVERLATEGEAARIAARTDAVRTLPQPHELLGCWESEVAEEGGSPAWQERYRGDGTFALRLRDPDTGEYSLHDGYWAASGATLVELLLYGDLADRTANGRTTRYEVVEFDPRGGIHAVASEEDAFRARPIECPPGL